MGWRRTPRSGLASLARVSERSFPTTFECPGHRSKVTLRSGNRSKAWEILVMKIREKAWAGWGEGSVMFFRAATESEKMLISERGKGGGC